MAPSPNSLLPGFSQQEPQQCFGQNRLCQLLDHAGLPRPTTAASAFPEPTTTASTVVSRVAGCGGVDTIQGRPEEPQGYPTSYVEE